MRAHCKIIGETSTTHKEQKQGKKEDREKGERERERQSARLSHYPEEEENDDDEGYLIFKKRYHLLRRFPGISSGLQLRGFREPGGVVSIWNGSPSKPRYVLIREVQILVLFLGS